LTLGPGCCILFEQERAVDIKVEAAARKIAIFQQQVKIAKSGAAGTHGGGKRTQSRKRRQEAKRQARDW